MSNPEKILYCPALRMKTGELNGVRELAQDVAEYVVPRFIVPPIGEREEGQLDFVGPGNTPDLGGILTKYWCRRVFIDLTYLIDEAGRGEIGTWAPPMFQRARNLNVRAIPMVRLRDLRGSEAEGFKATIAQNEMPKFAISVCSGEMVEPDFSGILRAALSRLGLATQECAIIADFTDSDFSQPNYVSPIVGGALEQLQDIGEWGHVIFQGTHFPEKNPAEVGGSALWPRNEWLAGVKP